MHCAWCLFSKMAMLWCKCVSSQAMIDYSKTPVLHFCGDHLKWYEIWEALLFWASVKTTQKCILLW